MMTTIMFLFTVMAQESVVNLPLTDYLELKKAAEQLDRDQALMPELTLVSCEAVVHFKEKIAEIDTNFTIQVSGKLDDLAISLTGTPVSAVTGDQPSSVRYVDGKLWFTPLKTGRHQIKVRSVTALSSSRGTKSMRMAPFEASVNRLTLVLESKWDWRLPDAALIRETTGEQETSVELAPPLGIDSRLSLVPKLDQNVALRAEATLVTIMDVGRDSTRFLHGVFYKVYSGSLAEQSLVGLDRAHLEQAWTSDVNFSRDEVYQSNMIEIQGQKRIVNPAWNSERASIPLIHLLEDTGYAVWKTRPLKGDTLTLPSLDPGVPIRAHFLVQSSSRVVEAQLSEVDGWQRVDMTDLPAEFTEMAKAEQCSALSVWRRAAAESTSQITLKRFPDAEELETVVASRTTTTLVTIEGRLVHRDVLQLKRMGSFLEMTLPATASLWSTLVDGVAIRPLVQGDLVKIPVTPGRRDKCELEVVSVAEHNMPSSRTTLALSLPAWRVPVLQHEWKLVLPEHRRYRFRFGDLEPVPLSQYEATGNVSVSIGKHSGGGIIAGRITDDNDSALPGVVVGLAQNPSTTVVTDADGRFKIFNLEPGNYTIVATMAGFNTLKNEVLVRSGTTHTFNLVLPLASVNELLVISTVGKSRKSTPDELAGASSFQNTYLAQQVIQEDIYSNFQAGLVGGVRPIPVAVPETGKLMVFSGVLPPSTIRLELDVKK